MVIVRLWIAAMTIVFFGCTGKSSNRTLHEGPIGATGDTQATVKLSATDSVMLAFSERIKTSERIRNSRTAAESLTIATQLERIILNSAVLSNPALSGSSQFAALISQFNSAFLKAMEQDFSVVKKSGLMERYEAATLAHCTLTLRTCVRLARFKSDHLTSNIFMRIAGSLEPEIIERRNRRESIIQRLADPRKRQVDDPKILRSEEQIYFPLVQRYFRLLMVAYETSNGRPMPLIDQKYVNFSRDYFEYFRSLSGTQKQPELQLRHRDTLMLALGHLRNQSRSGSISSQYCQFMIALNPLDTEIFTSINMDKRAQRSMIAEFVECASQNGKLNALISEYVKKQNVRQKATYQADKANSSSRLKVKSEGYTYALEALREVPFLVNNLDIQMTSREDLAFYILDNVFYKRMDLNVALDYWLRAGKINDTEFLKFARNYARVQTAYVLQVTLKNYGKILSEQFARRGGLSSDFFYDVVTEVNSGAQFDWVELLGRLQFLREFFIKVYDEQLTRRSKDLELQKEYLGLKEDLGAWPDHIAMAVSAPMTIPLNYYMAKAQGTIKIHLPWLKSSDQWVDIVANETLSKLLSPDFNTQMPFFNFGSLDMKFDLLGKLHMLDYAFRTGIFEFVDFALLEEDKQTRLAPEVLFFKQYTKDLLTTSESSFRSEIEKLEASVRNRNFSQAFMGACEDPVNAPVSYSLSDLGMGTFLRDQGMLSSIDPIYMTSSYRSAWRLYRDHLMQFIRVMEHHLGSPGAEQRLSASKARIRNQIIDQVRAEVEQYASLERKWFALVIELDRMIVNQQRNCLVRLIKAEFLRRGELMSANVDFYKNIHAGMSILNVIHPDNPTTIDEAIKTFTFRSSSLEGDVKIRANRLLAIVKNAGLMGSMTLSDALNEILRIHNINKSPYDQIGFYVAGLETYEQSGKRVKSLNSFTHKFFYQGKWDSLIRIRQQLSTLHVDSQKVNASLGTNYQGIFSLAPNTHIPLGTFGELELKAEYKDNAQKNIVYTTEQLPFVRAALIQLAGAESGGNQYISWYNSDISLVEKRLNWLKSVQELGAIETSDDDHRTCPRDKWGSIQAVKDVRGQWLPGAPKISECNAIRVSSGDVIEAYLSTLSLLQIPEIERELLDLIDRPGRLEKRIKYYLMYNSEPSTSKWTYFDQFYRSNYTTFTAIQPDGKSWKPVQKEDIRGRGEFRDFKDSFLRNIESSPALFPMRKAPTQIRRDHIRKRIDDHLEDILNFEESAYDLEQREIKLDDFLIEKTLVPRPDERLVFGNWRVMEVKSRPTGPRQGKPIYLKDEDSAKSWFDGFLETFVIKDTDCLVLPVKGDPDYKAQLQGSCRERYNAWKAERERYRMQIRSTFEAR